jgi:hypothetical protein
VFKGMIWSLSKLISGRNRQALENVNSVELMSMVIRVTGTVRLARYVTVHFVHV